MSLWYDTATAYSPLSDRLPRFFIGSALSYLTTLPFKSRLTKSLTEWLAETAYLLLLTKPTYLSFTLSSKRYVLTANYEAKHYITSRQADKNDSG